MIVKYSKELVKLIEGLGYKHGKWEVFNDFIAMGAFAISNGVDHRPHRQDREDEYMKIVKKYNKDELNSFCEMLGLLALELETHVEEPQDVLGEIFTELGLHNQWKGQIFTPPSICELMGELTGGVGLHEEIEKNGYVTLNEPCIGSGNIVLGFCRSMAKAKLNYQKQLVVVGVDIDIRCVYMSYIQLSLMGIPAVIIHGNTLSLETWGADWRTPFYILGGWYRRFPKRQNEQAVQESEDAEQPDNSYAVKDGGQLSFINQD